EESDGSFFDTDASENTNTSTLKRKRVSVRKICKQCNKKKRKHRKVDGPVPSNECQCIFDDEMAVPTQSLGNNFTPPAPLHSSTPLLNESNVSQRVQPPPTEQPSAPVARPRPSKGYNRSEHETLTRDYNTPFAPSKSILVNSDNNVQSNDSLANLSIKDLLITLITSLSHNNLLSPSNVAILKNDVMMNPNNVNYGKEVSSNPMELQEH
ncbi:hypothetical protein HF086_011446, partial [Spodoptera exigua]